MTTASPHCRHCARNKGTHSRGMCYPCFRTPGVRDQYPPRRPVQNPGVRDGANSARPPTEPTPAVPGTPAKMDALAARVKRGEALHHAGDARHDLT